MKNKKRKSKKVEFDNAVLKEGDPQISKKFVERFSDDKLETQWHPKEY